MPVLPCTEPLLIQERSCGYVERADDCPPAGTGSAARRNFRGYIYIYNQPGLQLASLHRPGCNLQILLSSDEPNGQTKTRVDHRMSCLQGKLHPARSPPEEVASNSLLKLSPVSLRWSGHICARAFVSALSFCDVGSSSSVYSGLHKCEKTSPRHLSIMLFICSETFENVKSCIRKESQIFCIIYWFRRLFRVN